MLKQELFITFMHMAAVPDEAFRGPEAQFLRTPIF